jgi:chemotaxis methyl-accepting protein methylase
MPNPPSPTGPRRGFPRQPAEAGELRHIRFSGWPAATPPRPRRLSEHHGAPEETSESLDELVRHVLTRSGLDPDDYRVQPINRRVPACLRALKVRTTPQAIERLQERPKLLSCALDVLLIGVGEFFRDPGVMAALARQLPEVARRRGGKVHAWSAACGNGAELYSLAIVLAESGLLPGSVLLGTDCRATAIATASRGVYHEEALRKVPAPLRDRYFASLGDAWRVALPPEGRISWQVANVLGSPAEETWDLILCRNVAIYLRCEAGSALWATLIGRLRPGGLLVVGNAERPSVPGLDLLERCVYLKNGGSDA